MKKILFVFIFSILLTGCVTAPEPLTKKNSELTQGMVQMNLEVGKTTKADVLETFGAPNITTRDSSGNEVWTYQRQAQVSQSSSSSGFIFVINLFDLPGNKLLKKKSYFTESLIEFPGH